ncbi:MAG TPA: 1,4-alpha-glucan branching enzyme, partial [Sandaracinaceae bacterium]
MVRPSRLSDQDLHLFHEGTHLRLWERLGAHPGENERGEPGTWFAVWAPNARAVSVIGDWNGWDGDATPLSPRGESGIWEGFVPGVGKGELYKYLVRGDGGYVQDKADPFGLLH